MYYLSTCTLKVKCQISHLIKYRQNQSIKQRNILVKLCFRNSSFPFSDLFTGLTLLQAEYCVLDWTKKLQKICLGNSHINK